MKKKLETARLLVPAPELFETPGAEVGVIAFGSSDGAVHESRDQLAVAGIATSYLRVRGLPFHPSIADFVRKHTRVYVVEQNRDAQLASRVQLEVPECAGRVRSVLHYIGLPLDAASVTEGVLAHEKTPVVQGATR